MKTKNRLVILFALGASAALAGRTTEDFNDGWEFSHDGKSQGRRRKDLAATTDGGYYAVMPRYRLMWNDVTYEPGEVRAVAYGADGKAVGEELPLAWTDGTWTCYSEPQLATSNNDRAGVEPKENYPLPLAVSDMI